jgi:predicted ATPase
MNVLIGANGVGKSSILEVMDLLASSAEGKLEGTISDNGGISSFLTADGKTSEIDLAVQMPVEGNTPLDYQIRLVPRALGYAIAWERLTQQQKKTSPAPFKFIEATSSKVHYFDPNTKRLVEPNWEFHLTETALSQVPRMFQVPEEFRRLLASQTEIYHALDVSPRAPVRVPQPIGPENTPGSSGENLISSLFSMRERQPERFEAIEAALRLAFPTFEKLSFLPVATGTMTLGWHDKNFSRPIYPNQMSEGTLRFLWLIALLQSEGLPRITLIDEPEVSLHPEMLRILAEMMREASLRTQLIVASHSDRFIRFLKPEELLVCDLDSNGGTVITRADEMDLERWMDEYTLDQLWGMGRLGGRPVEVA